MPAHQKKKNFIKLPQYPGGKPAFIEFMKKNLQYPPEAIAARIEGKVMVAFEIDDNGDVHNPHIINGIGHGCDEEALRLVSLLKYEKVKNRGMRVRAKNKTSIQFKLPKAGISYTITESKKPEQKTDENPVKETYEYTIRF